METQFNYSLAGTERKYVVGQVKAGHTHLHIQIGGPVLNRTYGGSFDIPVDANLRDFVKSQYGSLKSLASHKKDYLKAQFDFEGEDTVKIQVAGSGGNRNYGYTATFKDADLVHYLKVINELKSAKAAPTVVAPMWDNDDDGGDDDGEYDNDDNDNENTKAEFIQNTLMELSESLGSILELVKTAQEELAQLKSKVG